MDTELVTYKKECANEYVRSNQHDSNYFGIMYGIGYLNFYMTPHYIRGM